MGHLHHISYLHHINKENNGSAYYYHYNALKYLKNASFSKTPRHKITQANILSNIAFLQKGEQDYVGSQTATIQAINFLLTVPESKESLEFLSNAYNLLGLNLCRLKEYDKALDYYQKALSISNNFIDKLYVSINIAEAYQKRVIIKIHLIYMTNCLKILTFPKKMPMAMPLY